MTQADLHAITETYHARSAGISHRVVICAGTGCVANGALALRDRFLEVMQARGIPCVVAMEACHTDKPKVHLSKSGCQGFCQMGPLVTIYPEKILYTGVTPDDVEAVVERTLLRGELIDALLVRDNHSDRTYKGPEEIPFYTRQKRSILAPCSILDPEEITEYIAMGGYEAARRAFRELTPETICEEIERSGLKGRGGGGFPTGTKWRLALREPGSEKYIICNGDEGDPGAFMDRSLMEGNPHCIIEGMLIAARAVGATRGYIYVRAEYPLAVQRLTRAVEAAAKLGLLGEGLFGTTHDLTLEVLEGAGAFVCGEETALMASIMGERGMPLPKPPFPAQKGLWGKSTTINNVETLATVPSIINSGAHTFRALGTEGSPGTKTFALTGHVANAGLIEVPFGTTLREIIFDIGGGVTTETGEPMPGGFKAVQIGGPSGGCLTREHLDLPLDYDSLKSVGAMVGSGGLVVLNEQTCMVKIARFFMQFTQNESCGKCVMCREGTRQMLGLLDSIIEGKATTQTIDLLEELANGVAKTSLCGLGKTAPGPVLSTLTHFRAEYEAHVVQKRCPADRCEALAVPLILADKCRGCTLCARKCPVGAITGERKKPHIIDPDLCIRCGVCKTLCKFDAVKGVG